MRRAIRLNFWSTFQAAILQKPKSSDILTTLTLRYSPEEVREETGRRGGLWNQCSWVHWAKLWPESFQRQKNIKVYQSHLVETSINFRPPGHILWSADWVLDRSSKNRHASLAIHGPPGCRTQRFFQGSSTAVSRWGHVVSGNFRLGWASFTRYKKKQENTSAWRLFKELLRNHLHL